MAKKLTGKLFSATKLEDGKWKLPDSTVAMFTAIADEDVAMQAQQKSFQAFANTVYRNLSRRNREWWEHVHELVGDDEWKAGDVFSYDHFTNVLTRRSREEEESHGPKQT